MSDDAIMKTVRPRMDSVLDRQCPNCQRSLDDYIEVGGAIVHGQCSLCGIRYTVVLRAVKGEPFWREELMAPSTSPSAGG